MKVLSEHDIKTSVLPIFERLLDSRISFREGFGWTSPRYDSSSDTFVFRSGEGLYSGALGIAVFCSAMYDYFEEERFRKVSEDILDPMLDSRKFSDMHIGGATGIGSWLYSLTLISQFLGDESILDELSEILLQMDEDKIEKDERLDVMYGSAGAILGLLKLNSITEKEMIKDKAVRCGDHILEEMSFNEEEIKYRGRDFSFGFSHGISGIGYSLLRLWQATDADRFRERAVYGLEAEKHLYESRNLVNLISGSKESWCQGRSGFGLAMVASNSILDDESFEKSAHRVLENTPDELSDVDNICHGSFSRVELFLSGGRKIDGKYRKKAGIVAEKALNRSQGEGFQLPFHDLNLHRPSFFLGEAGIGYSLLRLLRPHTYPSILLWE